MPSPMVIPRSQKPLFRMMLVMDDSLWAGIISALKSAPACADVEFYIDGIVSQFPDVPKLENMLGTVISLYSLPEALEISPERVAVEVSNAYADEENSDETDRVKLKNRLQEVLGFINTIGLTAKAHSVIRNNDKTFTQAKIITDIRSVFQGDETQTPAGAVFVHTLDIDFRTNSESKEFFVTLDSRDLRILKSAIKRAEEKEAGLREQMQSWGLRALEVCGPEKG